MAHPTDRLFREAAETLRTRGNAVALTGAGISVESGIPAFRGTQGMWEKYDPVEYATIGAFLRNPEKVVITSYSIHYTKLYENPPGGAFSYVPCIARSERK